MRILEKHKRAHLMLRDTLGTDLRNSKNQSRSKEVTLRQCGDSEID